MKSSPSGGFLVEFLGLASKTARKEDGKRGDASTDGASNERKTHTRQIEWGTTTTCSCHFWGDSIVLTRVIKKIGHSPYKRGRKGPVRTERMLD